MTERYCVSIPGTAQKCQQFLSRAMVLKSFFSHSWSNDVGYFTFDEKGDAVMFKLMWGGL